MKRSQIILISVDLIIFINGLYVWSTPFLLSYSTTAATEIGIQQDIGASDHRILSYTLKPRNIFLAQIPVAADAVSIKVNEVVRPPIQADNGPTFRLLGIYVSGELRRALLKLKSGQISAKGEHQIVDGWIIESILPGRVYIKRDTKQLFWPLDGMHSATNMANWNEIK